MTGACDLCKLGSIVAKIVVMLRTLSTMEERGATRDTLNNVSLNQERNTVLNCWITECVSGGLTPCRQLRPSSRRD